MPRAKKEIKIIKDKDIKEEKIVEKETQPIGTSRKKKESTKVDTKKQTIGTSRIKKEEPTVDVFAEFKEELKKELYKEIREQVIAENKRLEHIEKTKEKVEATDFLICLRIYLDSRSECEAGVQEDRLIQRRNMKRRNIFFCICKIS